MRAHLYSRDTLYGAADQIDHTVDMGGANALAPVKVVIIRLTWIYYFELSALNDLIWWAILLCIYIYNAIEPAFPGCIRSYFGFVCA